MHTRKRAALGITQSKSMTGKVAVMGLLERHGKDGSRRCALEEHRDRKKHQLKPTSRENVVVGASVYTDALSSYSDGRGRLVRCLTSSICAGRMCQESLTRHRAGARRDGDVVSREECLDFVRVDRPGVGPYFWLVGRSLTGPGTSMAERSSLSSRSFSPWKSSLHVAIAVRSPRDARAPKDEREVLIDLKATRTAFYVLFAGRSSRSSRCTSG